jgi:hypothetical protein
MCSAAVRRELAKLGIAKLVPGKTNITIQQNEGFAAVLADEVKPVVVRILRRTGWTPIWTRRPAQIQPWYRRHRLAVGTS